MDPELELYKMFQGKGYTAIRVAFSGRGQLAPDILVIRRGVLWGFEVKERAKHKVFRGKDFDNLQDWLIASKKEGIPARAFLAVKVGEWRFFEVTELTKEIDSSAGGLKFEELIRIMDGRAKKKLDCSIRVMGGKEDVHAVLSVIKQALESAGYKIRAREYPVYKDKRKRDGVDPSRTRVYISL